MTIRKREDGCSYGYVWILIAFWLCTSSTSKLIQRAVKAHGMCQAVVYTWLCIIRWISSATICHKALNTCVCSSALHTMRFIGPLDRWPTDCMACGLSTSLHMKIRRPSTRRLQATLMLARHSCHSVHTYDFTWPGMVCSNWPTYQNMNEYRRLFFDLLRP